MEDFSLWFTTGLEHIADWQGYDHILFLIVLSAAYDLRQWKELLVLVTAFTVGHSLTLALSILDIVSIKSSWIEALIPLTIMITSGINLMDLRSGQTKKQAKFLMAIGFGLIHGMGFSYLLRSLLGHEENITGPLLAFNLGLEAGQLLILVFTLAITSVISGLLKTAQKERIFFISSAVFGIAMMLFLERLPYLFEP